MKCKTHLLALGLVTLLVAACAQTQQNDQTKKAEAQIDPTVAIVCAEWLAIDNHADNPCAATFRFAKQYNEILMRFGSSMIEITLLIPEFSDPTSEDEVMTEVLITISRVQAEIDAAMRELKNLEVPPPSGKSIRELSLKATMQALVGTPVSESELVPNEDDYGYWPPLFLKNDTLDLMVELSEVYDLLEDMASKPTDQPLRSTIGRQTLTLVQTKLTAISITLEELLITEALIVLPYGIPMSAVGLE